MVKSSTAICGHTAEHFVCYDLARRGISAVSNPFEGSPYDIIADYNGVLIRIQVKGTSKAYSAVRTRNGKSWNVNTYIFRVNESQLAYSELVAFVALDLQTIIYRTPEELANNSTGINIKPSVMKQGCDKSLLLFTSGLP